MRLSRLLKDYRESGPLNALVSVHAAVDERTFATKAGGLLQVLAVEGQDYECLDLAQVDRIARRFEAALRGFDEKYRIYQYVIRRNGAEIPHENYEHPVVRTVVESRAAHFRERSAELYSMSVYFVVVYEGWKPGATGRSALSRLVAKPRSGIPRLFSVEKRVNDLEGQVAAACEALNHKISSFIIQLTDVVRIERLDKRRAYRVLRQLLNYAPEKAAAVELKYDGCVDFQACDSSLECHRDHLCLDDYFVQVLTLKSPPVHTFANLLRGLQEIRSNAIAVSEWKPESSFTVRKLIQSKRRHFHNAKTSMLNYLGSSSDLRPQDMLVDDGAAGVVTELGGCLAELELHGRRFGQFSLSVVLFDFDRGSLRRSVAECIKVLGAHDGQFIEERYNLLNAWVAALPGNHAHNLRRLWISDANYADLAFLFTQRTGAPRNAHLNAEYLAAFETEAGTPYFFNLHYKDNAHTLILGATGSGKSFLASMLLASLQKYGPFTFIFDLGGGYESLTRLFGGTYLALGPETRSFSINPFSLPPTRENHQFLLAFFKVLIESGGHRMTAPEEQDLAEQIENIYAIDPRQRRLSTLANIVGRNLRTQLLRWVEGGPYGGFFDSVDDTLTFAPFQTFDFQGAERYGDALEALLFYVLHRANALIYDDAQAAILKVFMMDEAWRFFRHPAIRAYLIEALKTWRKKNAAMILATQSVDDLVHSEMLPVVTESCATRMFLASPGIDPRVYRDVFHLNETETAWIAKLVPKRQILIKKPDLAKVVNLNVDPKSYWLYTNSPYDNVRRKDAFERYGMVQGLEILARSQTS
jgi:type IV secretion system protein VirB4